MKQLFLSFLCIIPAFSFSMNNEKEISKHADDLYLRDENGKKIKVEMNEDSACLGYQKVNDDLYYPTPHPNGKWYLMKETYPKYFKTFHASANEDDTVKQISVCKPFFIQLLMQALKDDKLCKNAFYELVDKIRLKEIDTQPNIIHATKKDIYHRLLTYIPYGKLFCLVNGKRTRIMFETKTVMDMTSKASADIELASFDHDLFPEHDSPNARSFKGVEHRATGELVMHSSDYDFTSDREHHQRVVNEFLALI